jgi:hypothetical protein
VLWTDWRTSLLKDGRSGRACSSRTVSPRPTGFGTGADACASISRACGGDFTSSVDRLTAFLRTDPGRCEIALERALRSNVVVDVVDLATISVPASGGAGPAASQTTGTDEASARRR